MIPTDIADAGMSSTASIRSITQSRSGARTGAKPTPQLPITTVVTPLQHDGVRYGSHDTCASMCVCTSIQPGVTSLPAGVDLAAAGPHGAREWVGIGAPHRGDAVAVDADVAPELGRAAPVDDAAVANRDVVHGSPRGAAAPGVRRPGMDWEAQSLRDAASASHPASG